MYKHAQQQNLIANGGNTDAINNNSTIHIDKQRKKELILLAKCVCKITFSVDNNTKKKKMYISEKEKDHFKFIFDDETFMNKLFVLKCLS